MREGKGEGGWEGVGEGEREGRKGYVYHSLFLSLTLMRVGGT